MIRKLDLRIIFGVISLVIGLILLAIFGQQYGLNCTRSDSGSPECAHERSWFGLFPLSSREIERLSSARVGQNCDTEGCVHWVTLQTESESFKLDEYHSSRVGPKQEIADKINAYLEDSRVPAYEVKVGGGTSGKFLTAAFIGAGLLSLASYIISRLKRS